MSDRRLNQILVIAFFAAVVVTGFNSQFLHSQGRKHVQNLTSENKMQTMEASAFARAPASIQEEILEQNLFCKDNHDIVHSTRRKNIILSGANCEKIISNDKIEIQNVTNGSSISYFPLNKNKFKTDLIFLSPGHNKISIKYKGPKGAFVSQTIDIVSQD